MFINSFNTLIQLTHHYITYTTFILWICVMTVFSLNFYCIVLYLAGKFYVMGNFSMQWTPDGISLFHWFAARIWRGVWCVTGARRVFDPSVDLVTAPWSAFNKVSWLMPLLSGLSQWRTRLDQIQLGLYSSTNDTDVIFVADFPGLPRSLNNN